MAKRMFDITVSFLALWALLPVLFIIALIISIESRGGPFFGQWRVGKDNTDFKLYKFRSMYVDAEERGQLTVGKDDRITPTGRVIRKLKVDELPQLWNILIGEMSFVGPRPEVRKYVDMYTEEQMKVLTVLPGLTDYASLEYINENEILGNAEDPERVYVEEIMPKKLDLNLKYIEEQSMATDIKIIFRTIGKIFS